MLFSAAVAYLRTALGTLNNKDAANEFGGEEVQGCVRVFDKEGNHSS